MLTRKRSTCCVYPADVPPGMEGQAPAGAQHPALHDRHQAKFGALLEIQAEAPAAQGGRGQGRRTRRRRSAGKPFALKIMRSSNALGPMSGEQEY